MWWLVSNPQEKNESKIQADCSFIPVTLQLALAYKRNKLTPVHKDRHRETPPLSGHKGPHVVPGHKLTPKISGHKDLRSREDDKRIPTWSAYKGPLVQEHKRTPKIYEHKDLHSQGRKRTLKFSGHRRRQSQVHKRMPTSCVQQDQHGQEHRLIPPASGQKGGHGRHESLLHCHLDPARFMQGLGQKSRMFTHALRFLFGVPWDFCWGWRSDLLSYG